MTWKDLLSKQSDPIRYLLSQRELWVRGSLEEREGLSYLNSFLAPEQLELVQVGEKSPVEPAGCEAQRLQRLEAVHDVSDLTLDEYRTRYLRGARSCYILRHRQHYREDDGVDSPRLPLAFVHTVRMADIPRSMAEVFCATEPPTASSESPMGGSGLAFYSIATPDRGWRGLDVGRRLLHAVIQARPSEAWYSTLSPIPRFREWLVRESTLRLAWTPSFAEELRLAAGEDFPASVESLELILGAEKSSGRSFDPRLVALVQTWLVRNCARYLAEAKGLDRHSVLDSVEHFHLRNGAKVHRLLWNADSSTRRQRESFGMMVNYVYEIQALAERRNGYLRSYTVPLSPEIQQSILADPWKWVPSSL